MRHVRFAGLVLMASLPPLASLTAQDVGRPDSRGSPWIVSLAAGTVADTPLGIGREVSAHALVALSYAAPRWPVEVRGDLLLRSSASAAGYAAVNASAVLPIARVVLRNVTLRPYVLAGVGASDFGASIPRFAKRVGYHAGGGLRLEGQRAGIFSELRTHSVYRRSFVSVGAAWWLK